MDEEQIRALDESFDWETVFKMISTPVNVFFQEVTIKHKIIIDEKEKTIGHKNMFYRIVYRRWKSENCFPFSSKENMFFTTQKKAKKWFENFVKTENWLEEITAKQAFEIARRDLEFGEMIREKISKLKGPVQKTRDIAILIILELLDISTTSIEQITNILMTESISSHGVNLSEEDVSEFIQMISEKWVEMNTKQG